MATVTRTGSVTFEEFCSLIQPHQKADLIDGVIYMASPENLDSHRLFQWLYVLLCEFVQATDAGEIYGSRIAFRLGERQSPEPDIAFVRKHRLYLARKGYFDGPPDLAIEIVSPESVERDYGKKREQYRRAGVPEYWIVDEEPRRLTPLRLDARGRYREIASKAGAIRSQALPGFWLRPEWLWDDPRPTKSSVLTAILA